MIRQIINDDAEAIAEIYNYYIENTVITFEKLPLQPDHCIKRIRKVQQAGFTWLGAEHNGAIIGYAYSAAWNTRVAYKNTAEVSIYLSHHLTSKGWGTKLYRALFAGLYEKSIHIVIASITLPNAASVAIYEKFGMEKVGHFKEVGYKFGRWLDAGYWQMQLTA